MDEILGNLINDYALYRIIESIIIILILAMVYLGIQIGLALKFSKKELSDAFPLKKVFTKSSIFIFITGFFLLIHEITEAMAVDGPDYTTRELFELIAILGLVLFMYEWHKMLRK